MEVSVDNGQGNAPAPFYKENPMTTVSPAPATGAAADELRGDDQPVSFGRGPLRPVWEPDDPASMYRHIIEQLAVNTGLHQAVLDRIDALHGDPTAPASADDADLEGSLTRLRNLVAQHDHDLQVWADRWNELSNRHTEGLATVHNRLAEIERDHAGLVADLKALRPKLAWPEQMAEDQRQLASQAAGATQGLVRLQEQVRQLEQTVDALGSAMAQQVADPGPQQPPPSFADVLADDDDTEPDPPPATMRYSEERLHQHLAAQVNELRRTATMVQQDHGILQGLVTTVKRLQELIEQALAPEGDDAQDQDA